MTRVVAPGNVCCTNCFAYQWLKDYVAAQSTKLGICSYCESTNVPILAIEELETYFQNFMAMLERDTGQPFTHGESLIDKFQFGWDVFDEDYLAKEGQESLLADILNCSWDDDDGEPPVNATDDYVGAGAPWHDSENEKWSEFCSSVRRDPDTPLGFVDYLVEDLRASSVVLAQGAIFHRSRTGCERDDHDEPIPYKGAAIGPPPVGDGKPKAGRGNRVGQVVLYCADQEATAVAESRPSRGMYVSICAVRLLREARILDLCEGLTFNPFTSENAKYESEFAELVDGFADEMSRPLQREDDVNHYTPCQKLCDYLAAEGFDGVRYPSALQEDGTNVLLFDPTIGEVLDSKLVEVQEVLIEYDDVT